MVNETGTIELDSFAGMEQQSCNWTLIAPRPGIFFVNYVILQLGNFLFSLEEHVTLTIATLNALSLFETACFVKVSVSTLTIENITKLLLRRFKLSGIWACD